MSLDTQNTSKKPKNLWPYGILSVILIGIILIFISVRISLKNSVVDDMPFFLKHKETEYHINNILEATKLLEGRFDFYIQANVKPTKDNIFKPYSPYLRPPHRDKQENSSPNLLFVKSLNTLYVFIEPIDGDLQDLHIEAFLQKIGKADDRDQEVLIYNPKENLFTSSKPMQKGGQIPLGELILTQDKLFLSPSFEIELEGRWIVSLQITTKDEQIPVILEKEFFGIPKSESITNETPNI